MPQTTPEEIRAVIEWCTDESRGAHTDGDPKPFTALNVAYGKLRAAADRIETLERDLVKCSESAVRAISRVADQREKAVREELASSASRGAAILNALAARGKDEKRHTLEVVRDAFDELYTLDRRPTLEQIAQFREAVLMQPLKELSDG